MPPTTVAPEVGTPTATKVPSRKWIVTQITACSALVLMYLTTGGWDSEESIALVGLLTQASTSYLIPNAEAK